MAVEAVLDQARHQYRINTVRAACAWRPTNGEYSHIVRDDERRGAPGYLEQVEIDTAHFKGNFPESCELEAIHSENDLDVQTQGGENLQWTVILPRTKLGPHRQHYFQLENVENTVFTHVKMTIYPDGGVKRIRVIGLKADAIVAPSSAAVAVEDASISLSISPSTVPPTPHTVAIV